MNKRNKSGRRRLTLSRLTLRQLRQASGGGDMAIGPACTAADVDRCAPKRTQYFYDRNTILVIYC